jgi:hypothetical protein
VLLESRQDGQVFQIDAAINNKAAPVAANVQIVHWKNTSKVSLACNGSAFAGGRPGAYVNACDGDVSMGRTPISPYGYRRYIPVELRQ